MKKVILFFIILSSVTLGCKQKQVDQKESDWKELNLGAFKLSFPKKWHYHKQIGIDSFVGEIKGPNVLFSFDFSRMGYADSLIQTEQQYLKRESWIYDCHFCKSGVIYTNNQTPDIKAKRNLHIPTAKQKARYPKADYIADLTYQDSTIYIPIEIPSEIKCHHIQIDTTEKYIIKTVWPKVSSKGMTGAYIKSRSSAVDFQMSAINLSKSDQELALQVFKTIVIKTK